MERRRILCFGDSLTWGYDPVKQNRIDEDSRWTGVLKNLLGDGYRVIEEGQNGRTIATDDPAEGEKNGLLYVIPCIESHKPLDLMIVMLGTNDLKKKFSYTVMDIAGEMQIFLEKVLAYNRFRMEDKMKILLVAPPVTGKTGKGSWLEDCFDFQNAAEVSSKLPDWYRKLARMYGCFFLDAGKVVSVSDSDGVHLDAENQILLGEAIHALLMKEIIF